MDDACPLRRRRHLRFAAGAEAGIRPGASSIRLFTAKARRSPDPARARALMDDGTLADWLRLGLKRTVSGGFFTAILRADRLNEALAALPRAGCQRCSRSGPRRARRPSGRSWCRRAKVREAPFALLPGLVLHEARRGYTPEADAMLRGGSALALGVTPPVGSGPLPKSAQHRAAKGQNLPGPDPDPAEFLGGQGLPDPAALRQ